MAKLRTLATTVALVLALWGGCLFATLYVFDTWEDRGQFGDLFGAVNALFSGLAFAGILFTIFLQREELKLQREELRLQREEMVKARETMAHQAAAQQSQFAAAVAAIRVAAIEAKVEAIKMEAERFTPSFRDKQVAQIHVHAAEMEALANTLDRNKVFGPGC